jgi:hypothetical protein
MLASTEVSSFEMLFAKKGEGRSKLGEVVFDADCSSLSKEA